MACAACPFRDGSANRSYVEAEQQDVAILDDVVLAFDAQFSGFARARFTVTGNVIVVRDRFTGNEATFEVFVDDGGSLWRFGTLGDSPCPRLFRTAGEIGHQPQQIVSGADDPVET